jgi:hypothetical protein
MCKVYYRRTRERKGRIRTTSIDPTPLRSNRRHKHNTSPALTLHPLNDTLDKDEGCAQVNLERVVEFFEGAIPDVGDSFAVAGVRDEDVWAVAMFLVDFLEHAFNVVGGADVYFVD